MRHSADIDTRNPAKFAPYLRSYGGLRKVGGERVLQITQLPEFVPIDLWLDGRGLIRRQRVAVDFGPAHTVIREDYSGYSRAVTVDPPPADEVVDVTGQTAREVKRRLGP